MKTTKRWLALLLAALLMLTCLAGCGSKEVEPEESEETDEAEKTSESGLAESFDDAEDVAYVLIYNPDIYNTTYNPDVMLSTGDFDRQMIDTDRVRADGLELPDPTAGMYFSSQEVMDALAGTEGTINESDRAGILGVPAEVGDEEEFYCDVGGTGERTLETFVCRSVSEHANVWSLKDADDLTDEQADYYAQRFDEEIYDLDVSLFGTPVYADEGGKVDLLFYYLGGSETEAYTWGFFYPGDIFAAVQLPEGFAEAQAWNTDHAIININTYPLQYPGAQESLCTTIAHEFQHLIFETSIMARKPSLEKFGFPVWLNEAMSGYVEEALIPGEKDSDCMWFSSSTLIRHGQSLYNFFNNPRDIGVYGSVYLYSEFLSELSGEDVFRDMHDYLRYDASDVPTDAEVIYASVGEEAVQRIDEAIVFPESVQFASPEEEFMSKLTLAFYFSMLNGSIAEPDAYRNIDSMTLLFDELDSTDIEGGGRVIVATKDGSFEIPKDADSGLVYIGLDENFQPVTSIIYGE